MTGNSLTWGYRVNKAVLVYVLLTFFFFRTKKSVNKPSLCRVNQTRHGFYFNRLLLNASKPVFSHFRQKFTKIQAFLLPPSYKIVKVLFFGNPLPH